MMQKTLTILGVLLTTTLAAAPSASPNSGGITYPFNPDYVPQCVIRQHTHLTGIPDVIIPGGKTKPVGAFNVFCDVAKCPSFLDVPHVAGLPFGRCKLQPAFGTSSLGFDVTRIETHDPSEGNTIGDAICVLCATRGGGGNFYPCADDESGHNLFDEERAWCHSQRDVYPQVPGKSPLPEPESDHII